MTDITQRLRWMAPDTIGNEAADRIESLERQLLANNPLLEEAAVEIDRLRAALRTLYLAAPTALDCQDFHHSKAEQHTYEAPCKPRQDYLDALAAARTALGDGNADQA